MNREMLSLKEFSALLNKAEINHGGTIGLAYHCRRKHIPGAVMRAHVWFVPEETAIEMVASWPFRRGNPQIEQINVRRRMIKKMRECERVEVKPEPEPEPELELAETEGLIQ